MQADFIHLGVDDRLDFADQLMRLGRIRHMPVLDKGRLVGIVSNRDLLAASLTRVLDFEEKQRRTFLRSVEVREVMTAQVISVTPDTPVSEAARLMLLHKIGCLPVVDADQKLRGLLTETDLIRAAYLTEEVS
jgi:CBS domain-containing protein